MADGISSAIVTFDNRLTITFFNRAVGTLLGVEADVLERCRGFVDLMEVSRTFQDESVKVAYEAAVFAIANPDQPKSDLIRLAAASSRVFTLRITTIADGQHLASFDDITDTRLAETRAIEAAMRDPLTGLANRGVMAGKLATALEAHAVGGPTCVLMLIDLDRFKTVNDTLGHPIGDALLKLVAKRLGSATRSEELVARLGGDEFAVLLWPGDDAERSARIAKRLVDLLSRPYLIEGHLVHIGASIGIACAPNDGNDPDQMFRSADLALYQSKNSGRNSFSFFEAGMDVRAHARRSMEIDLRKAIALREFELHYQPQIDLEADIVVGFEALIRWRHPVRGLVAPNDFIPLCEEIGLVSTIGDWVMREACCEAMRWPDHLSVAVNVSPRQFEDPAALVASVKKALAASGLPGHRLEIEITEGVILRNETTVHAALHQLHDLRVKIAMDDFGTGYSSLSQLHSFPFDKIKIDRSLLDSRTSGGDPSAMIRAIAAMGASLGMVTIAEGVETTDQLASIRAVGCTSVQGYLFSRPVPVTAVADIIANFGKAKHRPQAA